MKEIKNYKELNDIMFCKLEKALPLALWVVLKYFIVEDGYIFIIGAKTKEELEMFYMSKENYNSLPIKERNYILFNFDCIY